RKSGDSIYYGQYDSTGASITTNTGVTTGIKATASTYNYNKITWDSLKGATGYRVYRKTQGQSWTNMGSVTTTQFVDRTAQCGVKYYYTVRAYRTRDGVTYWGQYDKTGAQVTTNNPKVSGITAARTTFNGIKLTWNEVKGATKYIILKKNDNGSWTNIGNTTELSYVDTTPQCGTQYTYTVRACRIYGGKSYYGAINNPGVTIQSNHCTATLQSLERTAAGVDLSWKKVGGATGYMVYRKVSGGKLQKLATVSGLSYTDATVDSGVYYYTVRAYRKTSDGIYYGKYNASGTPIDTGYAIMGQSNVSVQQMINYFNSSGKQFPAWVYAQKGASNIAEFCQLVYNIAVSEGVKAEVVFAQICKETGFLQFGGDVSAEQCNFAGMGATGNGEPGCWFADVAAGILGQVRHLKLYASTDINQVPNDGADPRYYAGLLGKAPYVEWLSIPHNPYGTGWAAAESYGRDLISMIWKMRSM
ncbi:MAG: glucosaminidase domain-containing protein, partial [Lachnospiraceae bacterium]|nr:glucosaminidase domain-containing protein [Lachnospiraceae bacterium]